MVGHAKEGLQSRLQASLYGVAILAISRDYVVRHMVETIQIPRRGQPGWICPCPSPSSVVSPFSRFGIPLRRLLSITMYWTTLLALAALAEAQGGANMLRFGCSQITIERLDPLVNPGEFPTPHMHQVVGGNAFNASMPSADIGNLATCTTCSPSDDLSNYWTANMYFQARNGSFKRVPQVPNRCVR